MATLPFVIPWPQGKIPYVIDHPGEEKIQEFINMANERTAIEFVKRKDESTYVHFVKGDGNVVQNPNWNPPQPTSDVLGYCEGVSTVILKPDPWLALHEIGHVVGLIHEHQRSDRNNYIKIEGGPDRCFNGPDWVLLEDSVNQDLPYNGTSVMHYGLDWQGCEVKWINGKAPHFQWGELTQYDATSIDILYKDLFPRSTPAFQDVWYGVLGLENTTDYYDQRAGIAIRGSYRFAVLMGYSAAMPTFEGWYAQNGVVFFGDEVKVHNVDYHELGLDHPTDQYDSDAGKAIRMTHRYAAKQGHLTGFPNFEAWYDNCGVVFIPKALGELRDVTYQELGLDKPTDQYDSDAGKAIRMTHRYAVKNGYLTGWPNFEAWYDNCGVVLIKKPSE